MAQKNFFSMIHDFSIQPKITSVKKRTKYFILIILVLTSGDLLIKSIVEKKLITPVDDYIEKNTSNKPLKRPAQKETVIYLFNDDFTEKKPYISHEVVVIPHFWSLRYIRNYNIGFSLMRSLNHFMPPHIKKRFIAFLQLTAVIIAIIYFFHTKTRYLIPFAMIAAGGLGNAIDRIIRGYVVDFMMWYIPVMPEGSILNPWPLFNLADMFVVVGVFFLITVFLRENKNEST